MALNRSDILEMGKIQYELRENVAKEDMFQLFEEPIISKDINKLLLEVYKYGCEIALKSKVEFEKNKNLIVQCKSGCYHCCKYPIQVLPFETILIKTYLRDLDSLKKVEIKKNIKSVKEKIKTSVRAKKHTEQYRKQYLDNEIFCPFLDSDSKSCDIYNVRPLSCMNYFEYISSENCKNNDFSPTSVNYEDIKFTVIFTLFHALDAYGEYHNISSDILKNRYIGTSKTEELMQLVQMGKIEMLPFAFTNADFN